MARQYHSLSIKAIEGELLPEPETYQSKLRAAVFDGVSQADVAEIVKGITAKAKEGDAAAIKMFFEYVVGNQKKVVVNNVFESPESAARVAKAMRSNADAG